MKQEEMVKCFFCFCFCFNRVTNHAWVYKMYRFKDQRIESDFIVKYYEMMFDFFSSKTQI